MNKCKRLIARFVSGIYRTVTFESILEDHPNGGSVIFFRSTFISLLLFLTVIFLKQITVKSALSLPSWDLLMSKGYWFATIFAATYTALYARFSSQWLYLSDVYNNIKKVEASGVKTRRRLYEWKAGFIEDAKEVHLATKGLFSACIVNWGTDINVQRILVTPASLGPRGYHALMEKVMVAHFKRFERLNRPLTRIIALLPANQRVQPTRSAGDHA